MSRNTMRNLSRLTGSTSQLSGTRIRMFAIIVIAMSALIIGVVTYEETAGAQNAQLKGILSRVNKFGQLVDPANEIGVNSLADVGYRNKNKNLEIVYGKVTIKLPKAKINENTEKQLARIGITLEKDKKGNYTVKYRDSVATVLN